MLPLSDIAASYGGMIPEIMAILCVALMVGLPGPTTQKPNTLHFTLLIVLVFSILDMALTPFYEYYLDRQRYIEVLNKLNDERSYLWFEWLKTSISKEDFAKQVWIMNYAQIRSWFAALDVAAISLILTYSQKGRALSLVFAAAIIINALTVLKIVSFISGYNELYLFGFNLISATSGVYNEYSTLIFYANISQVLVLIGASDGWSISSIRNFGRSVVAFCRSGNRLSSYRRFFNSIIRSHPHKRASP